jgi:AcrR family transcriptional regulator
MNGEGGFHGAHRRGNPTHQSEIVMRLISRKCKGLNLTRKKKIDRDRILDAAESVILDSGGRTFTLDAVAERAGISKGGLVYSFATKDGLVRAALEREVLRFQDAVRQRLGDKPVDSFEMVLAHIEEALDEDDATTRKAAFLVTALVHAPDMMEPARLYYRALLDPLLSKSAAAHDVRHALLAVEGVFLLRGLGFVEVSAAEHKSVLLHARDIVAGVVAGRRAPRRRTSGLGRKPPLRGA